MKTLVLGSGGRLGTLLKAGWPKDGHFAPRWLDRTDLDILKDRTALEAACDAADTVVLLAGVTSEAGGKPFDDNVALARATLDAAKGKRVLLTSSAAIYGHMPGPLLESNAGNPVSAYGKSKQRMERIAANYANATSLRIGNVAGADALLGSTRANYVVHQFSGGGYVTRSYIGPALLARTIAELCQSALELPAVLNIATPQPVSMADLLDAANLPWIAKPAPEGALETVSLDTTLLQTFVQMDPLASAPETLIGDLHSVLERQT